MEYKNTINALKLIGSEVKEKYKGVLVENKKIASGKLLKSIDYKVEYSSDGIKLLFIAEDYYINIENGRPPGAKMPPLNRIKSWMQFKGIIDRSAYTISHSIQKRGIKPLKALIEARDVSDYTYELNKAIMLDIKEQIKGYGNIR